MPIDRRRFVFSSLASALAPRLLALQPSHSSQSVTASTQSTSTFGSGHFGTWLNDEFGLPAYRYTCDQTSDPKARTSVTPGILSETEHIHQVGNDRITAIASNYGHVRVRQDEGAPKFLNDFVPENRQFAGGLGWLTDGRETLNTYYSGGNAALERTFGIGYFRKRVTGNNWSVNQIIAAPFGDDPVLLSQVTIRNRGSSPATVRWIEYWGCQPYEFSFRAFIASWTGIGSPPQLRRAAGQRFSHQVRAVNGAQGLLETRHFEGHTPAEDAAWQRIRAMLKAQPNGFISPVPDPQPGTSFETNDAPPTFLISLDGAADALSADGQAFFGSGGAASPDGLAHPLNGNLATTDAHTALLLERSIHLNPGEERTLSFLYGYLPTGFELAALVARYQPRATKILSDSASAWKSRGLRFSVDAAPWISRETAWNHYYLRSSLTFDDYFGQHILNQNGFYQYVMGFQGAARDPLQHSLPFLFSDPAIVKGVLRYTLSEVRPDGSVPYGLTGHGAVAPMTADNASDLPLWLLWAVSEYVLATRDLDFLDEQIPARVARNGSESVRNLLARCYHHQVRDVGVGRHGIVRMLSDDWNDGLLGTWAGEDFVECAKVGESVLNSAMSAWVFDEYARLLSYAGGSTDLAAELRGAAQTHREAARAQWTGKWLRRCWLGPKLGWLGEDTLWIEPQPWAILGGVTSPEQSQALVRTMNKLLRQGPIGASQMSQGSDLTKPGIFAPGTIVRGGIWPSLNQTLVWALTGVDPAMAWDEWKKNSFAVHAECYPDIWYGIWSGTDSYNAPFSKEPGATAHDLYFRGTDFPVLNLHAHACFLYSASKLLGIDFTEHGLTLRPALPEPAWRFESPLLGFSRSPDGHYTGWYAPSRAGTWTLRIELPPHEADAITQTQVNSAKIPLKRMPGGAIELTGPGDSQKPLRWSVLTQKL
jgi:hypothetical protein